MPCSWMLNRVQHDGVGGWGRYAYLRRMPPDADLKRLRWRAHHRGIREADLLVGAFFDARHQEWDANDRAQFAAMLDEQDVDILAWAHGTCAVPEHYQG